METGPPTLIEAIVGRLIPPASREHVLGDLRERCRSTPQFLGDAIRTLPFVVASQLRRASDRLLILMQGYTLFLVFRPQRFSSATFDQIWGLALPIAAALLMLALRDAYARVAQDSSPSRPENARRREDVESAFDKAVGRALVDAALAAIAAWVATPAIGTHAIGAFLMLTPVRIGWEMMFRSKGYRRLSMHSLERAGLTRDGRRSALEHRRDLLRSSWLWYPAPLMLLGYMMVLFEPSQNVWTVIVEASVTAFALLLMRAIFRRMADLLDRDINPSE